VVKDPRLPNFFILGAAKYETTSLYHYLKQHPEIYLPIIKEPHFFDNGTLYRKGLNWYLSTHFDGAETYRAREEATPRYFHLPQIVIPRLLEVYQEEPPKFIVIFRDPVKRAWSHYLHRWRLGLEQESFERALTLEEERSKKGDSWVSYFRDGLYAQQFKTWLAHFPKERFCFVFTEELADNPVNMVQNIFHFLGVDHTVTVDTAVKKNVAAVPRSMRLMKLLNKEFLIKRTMKTILPFYLRRQLGQLLRGLLLIPCQEKIEPPYEIQLMLRQRYREDILELQEIVDKDLGHWLRK